MPIIDRKLRVFLSYSKKDVGVVRNLYLKLTNEGWMDVWFDEEKLLPGQNWDIEIEKAVEVADVVLVCLSNQSVNREGYLQSEVNFILDIARTKPEETIFVIPLRLDECQVPRRLRIWQFVDYFPTSYADRAYQRLLASLMLRSAKLGISTVVPDVEKTHHVIQEYQLGAVEPIDKMKIEYRSKNTGLRLDELADNQAPEKEIAQKSILPDMKEVKSNEQKVPVALPPVVRQPANTVNQQRMPDGKVKVLPFGIAGVLLLIGALLLVFICIIVNGNYLSYILGGTRLISSPTPTIVIIPTTTVSGLTITVDGQTDFPMPDDASTLVNLGDDIVNFQTNLSLDEAMSFYRDEFGKLGYTERDLLTVTSDTTFSMVFDGHESGKAISVQGADLGDGTVNISIALVDL